MGKFWFRHHHVTDHFRKKSIVLWDTRDSQEHDAKNRLSIPSPSSWEPVAEVESVKKTDLRSSDPNSNFELTLIFHGEPIKRISWKISLAETKIEELLKKLSILKVFTALSKIIINKIYHSDRIVSIFWSLR